MKKKLLVLCVGLLLVSGCGKVPKLKDGKDAVVTINKKEKISVDDLYEKMKSEYALQTLMSMIDKNILESEYKNKMDEAKTYAESTIKSLKEQYGDQLQSMVAQYTGYQTVEGYQDSLYLNKLQEYAVDDYAKDLVEEKDIKNEYDKNTIGDIEISHILITADVTDKMTEDAKAAKEKEALDKANELIKQLKNSKNLKEDFANLAKENSKDDSTKKNGGSLGYVNYGTLSSDYDSLIDEAKKLKNNTISTTAIKTSLGYHIILRTNQKDKAKYDDVKDSIKETLASKKKSEDSKINIRAMQKLRKEHKVEIQDDELAKQYSNYITNALNDTTKK